MLSFSRLCRVLPALLLLLAAGCQDDLPTAVGVDRFPAGTLFTSIVLEFPAAEFLTPVGQFGGYTGIQNVGYGLVASRFDNELDARTLLRVAGFPDTITYTANGTQTRTADFVYGGGRMVARLDTLATATTAGVVTLTLRALTEEWDAGSATWELAENTADARTPWAQPGGALGRVLASATWAPGDTLLRDSVVWEVDALTVAAMAAPDFRGVAIVAGEMGNRVHLTGVTMQATASPAEQPDTVVTQVLSVSQPTVIFTPEFPETVSGWQVGGLTSARTLFRVALPDSVSACPPGTPGAGGCQRLALRDVNLNDVALLLDPLPVTGGFRPTSAIVARLRSVAEPELGRRAPLGPIVMSRPQQFAEALLAPELFAAPTDTTVVLGITQHVLDVLARDTAQAGTTQASTTLALLAEPEAGTFGFARFSALPRLRIVYTLPAQRTSP
ncbi:MAG: hypothetical protein H0X65_01490 [Gemmatimonadetes bacterium]|nr:hypothetical protein [Gemmatimonadota bacterium]